MRHGQLPRRHRGMRLGTKTSLTTFILILTIAIILSATALHFQKEHCNLLHLLASTAWREPLH